MYDEEPEVLEDMETLTKADDDHGKFAVMMIGESSSWNRCYMERNERREVGYNRRHICAFIYRNQDEA